MEITLALEVKLHVRRREAGSKLHKRIPLTPDEDEVVNAMVQKRIGELEEEIRDFLNTKRRNNDKASDRANRQRADTENTSA